MGARREIVDNITTARAWAEIVEKGGCTAKVLEQAPGMIGRLFNAERLLDRLIYEEAWRCAEFIDKQAQGYQVLIDHAPTPIRAEDLKRVKHSLEVVAKQIRDGLNRKNLS